jgi:predicted acylesterase/phospholipase RssA
MNKSGTGVFKDHCSPGTRVKQCRPDSKSVTNFRKIVPSTLVLPVSGHGMIEQIGMLLWLCERGYRPKVSLGASGGAIAAALGTTFQWNAGEWMSWMVGLKSVAVFKERALGYFEAPFRMSLYELGPGLEIIFNCITQPGVEEYFRNQELLVSAQNLDAGQLEIFSTVSEERSILHGTKGPLRLFGVGCIVTFLGAISSSEEYRDKLGKVLRATSAVPIVFPPIDINGNLYVDGGVSYSSPLNPLMSLCKTEEIIYIFPEDIEQLTPHHPKNTIDNGMAYLAQVSRSNYLQDRSSFLKGLCGGDFDRLQKIEGDTQSLEASLVKTRGHSRLCEIFPCKQRNLPIMSSHTKEEMMKRIGEQLDSFKFRIFYI